MKGVILFVKETLTGAMAMQTGRLFLWLPVFMGFGAGAYLALPFEPGWPWLLMPSMLIIFLVYLIYRLNSIHYLLHIFILFLAFMAGVDVCKVRTEHVRAPVLSPDASQYHMTAYIIDVVSADEESPRLLLAPIAIEGLSSAQTPLRLRLSLRPGTLADNDLKPGDAISVFALLNPPPSPFMPGGYDFAQAAYFQGIGGVGLVPGQPHVVQPPATNWRLAMVMDLNRLRWNITQKLVQVITPEFSTDLNHGRAMGGFAAALVTGHQAYVPQSLVQNMRDSGLAHILSISGVHMAIVGGFLFFGLRGLLAACAPLALRVPIKKVAAALSMIGILAYLAISGCPAPAVRAAVVACTAFGAILLDRRALSLRALAIAAIVVILLTPEAVIQPGFQMSFSATAALLALAETVRPRLSEISVPWWVKSLQTTLAGLRLSLVASIVATAATTPFAIAYFNSFSVYGLLTNLFEAPITGFIVMPFLALGTVFAATPPGVLCLRIAGAGLWLIDRVSAIAAALPHAVITWPSPPAFVLPLSFAGLLWVCLIRGRTRWAGLLAASTILWWPSVKPPDIWIDPQGGNAAIRTAQGAYVMRDRVRRYGYEQWTRHYGLTPLDATTRDADYVCKGYGCIPMPSAPYKVGFWFSNKPPKTERLTELCNTSDLVILRNPMGDWPEACAKVNHISAGDFRTSGALELTRNAKGWAIKAAQPLRGQRYWSSPSTEDANLNEF